MDPLVGEAMKKAAVAWIAAEDRPATAVWLIWHEDAAYLVHGGSEQPAPGLAPGVTCAVTVRGDHRGRILTWPAVVEPIAPGTPEWDAVAPLLATKRLNAPDPLGAPARWAAGSARISRLRRAGEPLEAGPTLPDGAQLRPVGIAAGAPGPGSADATLPL